MLWLHVKFVSLWHSIKILSYQTIVSKAEQYVRRKPSNKWNQLEPSFPHLRRCAGWCAGTLHNTHSTRPRVTRGCIPPWYGLHIVLRTKRVVVRSPTVALSFVLPGSSALKTTLTRSSYTGVRGLPVTLLLLGEPTVVLLHTLAKFTHLEAILSQPLSRWFGPSGLQHQISSLRKSH